MPGKFSQRIKKGTFVKREPYQPLPHQRMFHTCNAKYRAMVSGVGGGKTKMGSQEIIKWSQMYPGGRFIVGRLTSTALKDTTQKTFFDELDPQLIAHWQETRGRLMLHTPVPGLYTEILFRHLDDPGQLGSLDVDGWWIDEAHEPDGSEVPESTFQMLQARLRGLVGPLRGFITTNSGGRDWVYNWFFSPNRKNSKDYMGFCVKTRDNLYLPPGYEEMLRANNPDTWVKRFLDASFDVFEGQIFTEFDEGTHTEEKSSLDIGTSWAKEGGFDFGVAAPTAALICRQDPSTGLVVVTDEYHQQEADISVVAGWIKAHGLSWVWADPSTRNRGANKESPAMLYSREGITLQPSLTNDDDTKITTVHQYLIKNKLLIAKNCVHLIDSLKGQRWDSNREGKRLKQNDHAYDALAYTLVSLPRIGDWLEVVDPRKVVRDRIKHRHYSLDEDLDNEELMTEVDYIDYM